jgi:ATP-binding cassette subfamily B protein
MLENLAYGGPAAVADRIGEAVAAADLLTVLERLPDGLQTPLGEGGARLSGGEGQRVRLGRGMLRNDVRLVILDEPFRGLERERRRALLERCRAIWKDATLLCVTHDVGHTAAFDRVLVLDGGRVIEDAAPAVLAARADSSYRAMLDAEAALRLGLWTSAEWRRVRLEQGGAVEAPDEQADPSATIRPFSTEVPA